MAEWREAFCPLCRTSHGKLRITLPGKHWIKVGEENFWEKEYTGEIHFGVVKASEGRGTMRMLRYYEIDEDEEGYFPLIKKKLLSVLEEWQAKGWLTREEIEGSILE